VDDLVQGGEAQPLVRVERAEPWVLVTQGAASICARIERRVPGSGEHLPVARNDLGRLRQTLGLDVGRSPSDRVPQAVPRSTTMRATAWPTIVRCSRTIAYES
jgi:hypothetical protein